MEYVVKSFSRSLRFELTADAVVYVGQQRWSGETRATFALADLSPDVMRVITRKYQPIAVVSILLVVLAALLLWIFLASDASLSFMAGHQTTAVVIVLVFAFAVATFRPKLEYTTFRFRSGTPAFSVFNGKYQQVQYDTFIGAVTEAVAARARDQAAPPN